MCRVFFRVDYYKNGARRLQAVLLRAGVLNGHEVISDYGLSGSLEIFRDFDSGFEAFQFCRKLERVALGAFTRKGLLRGAEAEILKHPCTSLDMKRLYRCQIEWPDALLREDK